MTAELPLPAQLSQALVAFAIEFDNEFEHRMPHRTTRHGTTPGLDHPPYLVSMAMWVNCMRFVPGDGVPAGQLARRAQVTGKSMQGVLKRMSQWWGYLTVQASPAEDRAKAPRAGYLVRPTVAGRRAQDGYIRWIAGAQQRWDARFGAAAMRALREAAVPLGGSGADRPPLWRGLEPYPEGWRAAVQRPLTLPHFPVISARGGFPDGS
jgi:hypothetical protein